MSVNSILLKNFLFTLIILLLTGCTNNDKISFTNPMNMHILSKHDWKSLSEKSYFFAHQSVGKNIVDGMIELMDNFNASDFKIYNIKDNSDYKHPAFFFAKIGRNFDPKSKVDEFINILNSGLADSVDIAFLKLGYVDINKHTDIKELFSYYQTSIKSIQKNYPNLKILHFTIPLVIKPKNLKGIAKRILKLDNNVYINNYNIMIRDHYSDNELFDIAKIESTLSDNELNIYGTGSLLLFLNIHLMGDI